jgi:hypothetical protein
MPGKNHGLIRPYLEASVAEDLERKVLVFVGV